MLRVCSLTLSSILRLHSSFLLESFLWLSSNLLNYFSNRSLSFYVFESKLTLLVLRLRISSLYLSCSMSSSLALTLFSRSFRPEIVTSIFSNLIVRFLTSYLCLLSFSATLLLNLYKSFLIESVLLSPKSWVIPVWVSVTVVGLPSNALNFYKTLLFLFFSLSMSEWSLSIF